MEPKERNERMGAVIYFMEKDGRVIIFNDESGPAIRECDRKARAWDELEEYGRINKAFLMLAEMQRILSPTPKDPLEELEAWIRRNSYPVHCDGSYQVYKNQILAEIRRLRGAK
jgi:hypothetical protein